MKSKDFIAEFSRLTNVDFAPSESLTQELDSLLQRLGAEKPRPESARRAACFTAINGKFRLNSDHIADFFESAASRGLVFNYHEKKIVTEAFDSGRSEAVRSLIDSRLGVDQSDVREALMRRFLPCDEQGSLAKLHSELREPTLTRKDSKPKDWSQEILAALFGAYVYNSFDESSIHEANDPSASGRDYQADYWAHLHQNHPSLFSRENALAFAHIDQSIVDPFADYSAFRTHVFKYLAGMYSSIANHGFLAMLLDRVEMSGNSIQWELFGDIVLYAEKHLLTEIRQAYFRRDHIERLTKEYIPDLDLTAGQFHLMSHGFSYRDCFVVGSEGDQRLLLIFQKHRADETLIPCPRCRSNDVQGNSYSSFGVRSWECRNQFCADRSKFNRGKRYSFLQLLKQQAILHPENQIPVQSVRDWARDVQPDRSVNDIVRTVIQHYSLAGDVVHVFGCAPGAPEIQGRRIVHFGALDCRRADADAVDPEVFFDSPFFQRYCVPGTGHSTLAEHERATVDGVTCILGDSLEVLRRVESDSLDGAVTSPPYYNAREYSQWENIYCYLHDMLRINREVFRVLRAGSFYLFNIFDYFDNERNISLSAMGEKRMILGAYIIDIFRRIGFQCEGNVVWDKGDIEGKRGFNNGNFSPYYQSPFNCWEHVLVFRKPSGRGSIDPSFPDLLRLRPVFKMVRGQNVHGHTAPFPLEIPELLISSLDEGMSVLDPFAGSMTTGIAARNHGVRAICIEKDPDYFHLGLQKLSDAGGQRLLSLS